MSVPLVGAVDTAVVGHLPDPAYIGAVALGAVIFNFIFWGFGFLRMGTTGFVAQAYGGGDANEVRSTLARGLLLASVLGTARMTKSSPVISAAAIHVVRSLVASQTVIFMLSPRSVCEPGLRGLQ